MRQLTDIIDGMIAHIPPDQESLLYDLRNIRGNAEFATPDLMYLHFTRAAEALRDAFGDDPTVFTDWQVEVIRVWVDNDHLNREEMIAMG